MLIDTSPKKIQSMVNKHMIVFFFFPQGTTDKNMVKMSVIQKQTILKIRAGEGAENWGPLCNC